MKTKVIAFRVTQEEYDGLCFNAWTRAMKPSEFVLACLRQDIDLSVQAFHREQKRLQAKAKRDAKKAAANGVQ
jgi:hypothetical protein